MHAVVVYESIYGNTRQVAEAIAEGLGRADVVPVARATEEAIAGADLLVVGGPTHMHGMATSLSRRMAVKGAEEDKREHHLEPGAADGPGLRHWLSERTGDNRRAVAFDTRLDRSAAMTGAAARAIARRLRHRGYDLVADPESFLVDDAEGPVLEGELDRARVWGETLARYAVPV